MFKKLISETLGTFWLVLGGCGSAVLAAGYPELGIGFTGVALAFGLTVLTGAYALWHVSGAHFNPAVSFGLWAAGRFPGLHVLPYAAAQVAGGLAGAGVLYVIARGGPDFTDHVGVVTGFATNGYGTLSPGHYSLVAVALCEVVLTAVFVLVIAGVTDHRAPAGFAPLAIGLCLTLIHLISIPVDNTSVNPARSTAVALFVGGEWVSQVWLFWAAPVAGGILGGLASRLFYTTTDAPTGACKQAIATNAPEK